MHQSVMVLLPVDQRGNWKKGIKSFPGLATLAAGATTTSSESSRSSVHSVLVLAPLLEEAATSLDIPEVWDVDVDAD